jgi:hypothetical protein
VASCGGRKRKGTRGVLARAREKGEHGRRGFRARGRRGGGTKNRDGNASAARIYAPGRGRDDNLPLIPTCFVNLLEAVFLFFAKITWTPSSYTKLLKLLNIR